MPLDLLNQETYQEVGFALVVTASVASDCQSSNWARLGSWHPAFWTSFNLKRCVS